MKRAVACAFLLLSSLTLAAQNTGTASDGASSQARNSALRASDAFEVSHGGGTCPIGMRASQGLWDHTVAVRKGLGDQKFGQRISLTLKDAHPSRIETATVRVHGLTGKSYMLQTSTDTNETRDAARMLNVTLVEQADGTVSADLWISGFTSVSSVELQEVSYADGSSWRISENAVCRIAPDPIMLITSR